MAGRKPLPSAVKEARGNPGKRRLNDREPQAPAGMPACPAWLPKVARECWADLKPLLEGMRVVTVADQLGLTLLCAAFAEWREAQKVVEDEGLTYEAETESGAVMKRANPAVAIRDDAWRRVKLALAEFGLTPSARTRVKASEAAPDDPVDDLLDRGKKLRERSLRLVKGAKRT
jgi:P27 family predicted phage terminase small subunit